MTGPRHDGRTLITGATGFLGHVLVAEMLRRGRPCIVLVRDAAAGARKLQGLLAALGPRVLRSAAGQLDFLQGRLPNDLPGSLPCRVDRVVHAAACTRFELNAEGDPFRTNAMGTAALLRWCEGRGINEFHLVSTAYAYGQLDEATPEEVLGRHGAFRNAYELSKWTAEQHVRAWGEAPGNTWTIARPSIIVGDYATGRAARLNGLYIALRALARAMDHDPRRRGALRIEGRAEAALNFVPVDHVARAIACMVDTPELHNKVCNLVDPCPPGNQWLLDEVQRGSRTGGCRFVAPGALRGAGPTRAERSFAAAMRPLRAYLDRPCMFDRNNTALLERRGLGPWPRWDRESVQRLITASRGDHLMDQSAAPPTRTRSVAAFFEEFLPARLGRTSLAGMRELTTTFRFIVEGVENGQWVCRLQEGRLAGVARGAEAGTEDFSYRMGVDAFFDIVGATADPQEVFLEGRAHVAGDVERALKMGVILQQFNREHPYRVGAAALEEHTDA